MVAWQQSVSVTAGTVYDFSAWAAAAYPAEPANLEFLVGSTSLGTLQLSSTVGDWQNFTGQYTATTTGPVDVTIYDRLTGVFDGNDFALDDISFTVVPEPATITIWAVVGIVALGCWRRRRR